MDMYLSSRRTWYRPRIDFNLMNVSLNCTPHFPEVIVNQSFEATHAAVVSLQRFDHFTGIANDARESFHNPSMNAWNTDEVFGLDESMNFEAPCSK